MIGESELLKAGVLGFAALVLVVLAVPVALGFLRELRESRKERSEMRGEFMSFIQGHAASQTEALYRVKDSLAEVAEKLQTLNGRGRK